MVPVGELCEPTDDAAKQRKQNFNTLIQRPNIKLFHIYYCVIGQHSRALSCFGGLVFVALCFVFFCH